jgi:hypothetical protein
MWGEIFKEGLKIIGSNLLKGGSDDGGGSGRDFTPVSFDEYEMGMFKTEEATAIKKPEVASYLTYKRFWDERLLEYLNLARTIK